MKMSEDRQIYQKTGPARELKAFTIMFNILYVLLSAALMAVGVLALLDNNGMIQLNRINDDGVYTDMSTTGLLDVAAVMTICVGVGLFLLACYGIWAICMESKCLVALYIGGLVILVLAEVAIFGCSLRFTETINDDLRPALDQGIRVQFEGHIISESKFSKALDEAHIQFQCCGMDNHTEFKSYAENWFDKDSLAIPKSCCKLDEKAYFDNNQYIFDDIDCGREPTSAIANIDKGCYTPIKDWLEEKTYLLLGMSIAGAGMALVGLMISVCLMRDLAATLV